jgi:hypothetical protein
MIVAEHLWSFFFYDNNNKEYIKIYFSDALSQLKNKWLPIGSN